MKKSAIVNVILVGLGIMCLFSAEARCMRDIVHAVTDKPGLWRDWIGTFLGVLLIIVPSTFLFTSPCISSPRTAIRRSANVLRWSVAGLAALACIAFAVLNISWGISTNWTFIK